MTVGELREMLEGLDSEMEVVVECEDASRVYGHVYAEVEETTIEHLREDEVGMYLDRKSDEVVKVFKIY